ncbi:MAG: prepilin peptidase [Anaerolineales bacterium]|nr:prepilin peptidase [Anaerolineales bacterium]
MMTILIPIITGLLLSVVVNYLADVLPLTRKFSKPACPQCEQSRSITDYLLLRSCRQCGQRRSARTWLTILALIGLSMYVWTKTPHRLGYPLSIFIVAYLALIFITDMEHRLILHPTTIFGAFLGFGAGWLNHGLYGTLIGGFAGAGIMLALYYLGVKFARYRARQMEKAGQSPDDEEALGFGDVTLAGVLGLLLGWPLIWFGLLQGILLAGIFGALMIAFMLIVRKYKENALMVFMPYGPFLILSAFFLLFVPRWITLVVPK